MFVCLSGRHHIYAFVVIYRFCFQCLNNWMVVALTNRSPVSFFISSNPLKTQFIALTPFFAAFLLFAFFNFHRFSFISQQFSEEKYNFQFQSLFSPKQIFCKWINQICLNRTKSDKTKNNKCMTFVYVYVLYLRTFFFRAIIYLCSRTQNSLDKIGWLRIIKNNREKSNK